MRVDRHLRRTDLFLIRVWTMLDSDPAGEVALRGQVKRVVGGEVHAFGNWQGLIDALNSMTIHAGNAERVSPIVDDAHTKLL